MLIGPGKWRFELEQASTHTCAHILVLARVSAHIRTRGVQAHWCLVTLKVSAVLCG
jgi:hypothetical protein